MANTAGQRLGSNLLLMLVSILCTLLLLEGAFRLLDLRGHHAGRTRNWQQALVPKAERLPGVRVQFKPYSQFYLRYDSNPRGYFDDQNGLTYQMNQYGFRGPDYARQKPADTIRADGRGQNGYRNARGVGGKSAIRRADLVKLRKDLLFDVLVFKRRFNHQVGFLEKVKIVSREDALQN